MKTKEIETMEIIDGMCIQSLPPNLFEQWEVIKTELIKNRKSTDDSTTEKESRLVATEIIIKLNQYCLKQDCRHIGLPYMDKTAMAEMEEVVIKILNKPVFSPLPASSQTEVHPPSSTSVQVEELAKDMDKAIRCLAIELPEPVWLDVNKRWVALKGELYAASPKGKEESFLDVLEENYEAAKQIEPNVFYDGVMHTEAEKSLLIETYEDLISIYKAKKFPTPLPKDTSGMQLDHKNKKDNA